MTVRYTPRQGQFLAFIYNYTQIHGRPPAEADMERYFRVSPPSIHQMILRLEELGFISRLPGQPRSIRILVPPEELPILGEARVQVVPLQGGRPPREVHIKIRRGKGLASLFAVVPTGGPAESAERKGTGPGRSLGDAHPPEPGPRRARRAAGRDLAAGQALGRSQAYAFRVALRWDREVWRVIEVRGDQTLDDLHGAIQHAFGWDRDHLYAFFLSGKRWDPATEYADPRVEDGRPADQGIIAALGLRPRKRFLYLFDYGDELLHDVWLVGVGPADIEGRYPRIIKSQGEAPPQYPAIEGEE